jgi:hypothetical protein
MDFVQILSKDSKQTYVFELSKETINGVSYYVLPQQLSDNLIVACYINDKKTIFSELLPIEIIINSSEFFDMNTLNDSDFSNFNGKRYFKLPLEYNVIQLEKYPVKIKAYTLDHSITFVDNVQPTPPASIVKDSGSKFIKKINGTIHWDIFGDIDVINSDINKMKDFHFICYNGSSELFNYSVNVESVNGIRKNSSLNFDLDLPLNFVIDTNTLTFQIRVPEDLEFPNTAQPVVIDFKTHVSIYYVNV